METVDNIRLARTELGLRTNDIVEIDNKRRLGIIDNDEELALILEVDCNGEGFSIFEYVFNRERRYPEIRIGVLVETPQIEAFNQVVGVILIYNEAGRRLETIEGDYRSPKLKNVSGALEILRQQNLFTDITAPDLIDFGKTQKNIVENLHNLDQVSVKQLLVDITPV